MSPASWIGIIGRIIGPASRVTHHGPESMGRVALALKGTGFSQSVSPPKSMGLQPPRESFRFKLAHCPPPPML